MFGRRKKYTNLDRVRKMSVEELANFISNSFEYCPKNKAGSPVYCDRVICTGCAVEWLKAEVK